MENNDDGSQYCLTVKWSVTDRAECSWRKRSCIVVFVQNI